MKTLEERIHKTETCWIWTGHIKTDGYGHVWDRTSNKLKYAHRVAYEKFKKPIPNGARLDHTCHTKDTSCVGGKSCPHRRCVNPDHLEPISFRENVLRGRGIAATNAKKTHCKHGHEFTPRNTLVRNKTREGNRECRICKNVNMRKYYFNKKKVG